MDTSRDYPEKLIVAGFCIVGKLDRILSGCADWHATYTDALWEFKKATPDPINQ